LNLQLQRQRCSRPERFSKYVRRIKYFCFKNALDYPWGCKN
jgi:hypothetical protein